MFRALDGLIGFQFVVLILLLFLPFSFLSG